MEQLFTQASLDLLVAAPSQLPASSDPALLRAFLAAPSPRRHVFFDEQLLVLFVLRWPASAPPADFLSLLLSLQVVLEASYVPQASAPQQSKSANPGLGPALAAPSIFPPNTPFPLPQAAEEDLPYVESRGIPLATHVWTPDSLPDAFTLLQDEQAGSWLAVYKFQSVVEFPSSGETNPMLCYTVSATLRDKQLIDYPLREKLKSDLSHLDGLSAVFDPPPVPTSSRTSEHLLRAPPEANVLSNLPKVGPMERLYLPSSRLGPFTRQQAYSLAPIVNPPDATRSGASGPQGNSPVIRRSFRRVLNTTSGFHLRMLTMFVPYMIIPGVSEDEEAWIEAGSEERTVVLCVELDTRLAELFGYCVEEITVKIGGESTTVRLISWGGEAAFSRPEHVFPLLIRPREQYNLLYAVSLTQQQTQGRSDTLPEQRHISIAIKGKAFEALEDNRPNYLTASYVSRWSCVLDLSGLQSGLSGMTKTASPDSLSNAFEALPIPPSPFPAGPVPPHRSRPPTLEISTSDLLLGRSRSDKPLPPVDVGPGSSPELFETRSKRSGPDSQATETFTWRPPSGVPSRLKSDKEIGIPSLTPLKGMSILSLSPKTPKHDNRDVQGSPGHWQRFSPGLSTAHEIDEISAAQQRHRETGAVVLTVELSHTKDSSAERNMVVAGSQFALDIFVFNEMASAKRLEIGFSAAHQSTGLGGTGFRGIMPLENNCQIGPLQPQTCQSLRVKFIALEPGVHKMDNLTLTDLNSGHRVNLRSALDIVVLEDIKL